MSTLVHMVVHEIITDMERRAQTIRANAEAMKQYTPTERKRMHIRVHHITSEFIKAATITAEIHRLRERLEK